MNAQTKPAVTPGPVHVDGYGSLKAPVTCSITNTVPVAGVSMLSRDNNESRGNRDLLCDAINVKHDTGKTPSELAAEVAVLTAQLAEVREQRDYYRGVPAGAEVARLERAGAAAFEAMRKSQARVEQLEAALAHWQPIPPPPQKQMQELQGEAERLAKDRDALLAALRRVLPSGDNISEALAEIRQCEGAKA